MPQSAPIDAAQIDGLSAQFQRRWEAGFAWTSACSAFQELPGLRGFWTLSTFDSAGNAQDQSGHSHILTYAAGGGAPTYNYDGLVPYFDMDGNGYLTRADEADFDILGTEAYVAAAARGLTMGGWFWFDNAPGVQEFYLTKADGTVANTAYALDRQPGGNVRFLISDGAAFQVGTGTTVTAANTWYFIVGRFIPSTEAAIIVNGVVEGQDLVGIPAALVNSTSDFNIGAYNNGTLPTDGRASNTFLCAMALSDGEIAALYHKTKALYGVK